MKNIALVACPCSAFHRVAVRLHQAEEKTLTTFCSFLLVFFSARLSKTKFTAVCGALLYSQSVLIHSPATILLARTKPPATYLLSSSSSSPELKLMSIPTRSFHLESAIFHNSNSLSRQNSATIWFPVGTPRCCWNLQKRISV